MTTRSRRPWYRSWHTVPVTFFVGAAGFLWIVTGRAAEAALPILTAIVYALIVEVTRLMDRLVETDRALGKLESSLDDLRPERSDQRDRPSHDTPATSATVGSDPPTVRYTFRAQRGARVGQPITGRAVRRDHGRGSAPTS